MYIIIRFNDTLHSNFKRIVSVNKIRKEVFLFVYEKGIRLVDSDLWLDAERKVSFSFVSHGHADHLKNHTKIIGTKPTIRFFEHRKKKVDAVPLDFNEPYQIDGYTIELYPAGHILGSAMIKVEKNGVSLLYTGDFKMRPSKTAEMIEIPHADILIMESTFGRPEYTFVDTEKLHMDLIKFVEETLNWGATPAILAYSLGKGQEAMKLLGEHGFQLKIWGAMWELAEIYQEFGITFPNCTPWHYQPLRGEVLVMPPQALRYRAVQKITRLRTLLLSGWGADSKAKYRYGADEAIAFSDHADFNELIDFIKKINPQKVYTTHGFDDFPQYVRAEGFNAVQLEKMDQLSLF